MGLLAGATSVFRIDDSFELVCCVIGLVFPSSGYFKQSLCFVTFDHIVLAITFSGMSVIFVHVIATGLQFELHYPRELLQKSRLRTALMSHRAGHDGALTGRPEHCLPVARPTN